MVYASNMDNERKELWDILESVCKVDIPIMVIGNYNVIAVEEEKKGGRFLVSRKVYDFRSLFIEVGLCDLGFVGAKFTWYDE